MPDWVAALIIYMTIMNHLTLGEIVRQKTDPFNECNFFVRLIVVFFWSFLVPFGMIITIVKFAFGNLK